MDYVVNTLLVMFLFSFVVESIVEIAVGQAIDHFPKLAPFKWMIFYVAIIVGIYGAFVYSFDIIYLAFVYLDLPTEGVTVIGIVLTGMTVGSGAAKFHQIVTKYFPGKKIGSIEEFPRIE